MLHAAVDACEIGVAVYCCYGGPQREGATLMAAWLLPPICCGLGRLEHSLLHTKLTGPAVQARLHSCCIQVLH